MKLAGVLAIPILAAMPTAAQQLVIAEPRAPRAGVGVLEVTLSPAEITVGDRAAARLTLVWTGPPPESGPDFPSWRDAWGEAEVLALGEVEAIIGPGARRVYRQTLEVTAFRVGAIRLPAVTVALSAGGERIAIGHDREAVLTVRSVLPEASHEVEPRPAAPPRPLAAEALFTWIASAFGGLCLLLSWLLGRRLQAPQTDAAPRAEPLAELLERLRRLDPTAAEPAHTGLSLGLRDFLGRSLGFPATESTTTEIERRLRRTTNLPEASVRRDVARLLHDCDRVKFARAPVPAQVTRGRLRQARDLGVRIDRALRPADGAEASR